jgi:putative transposase
MARLPRIVAPGYPHHVTQRGVRSMKVFQDDDDRRRYLLFLKEETERFGVEIYAWCLMTNHVHFIAIPNSETALARAFGEAHRLYTRMKNFREGVRGYLFQGRFYSVVLDERHLLAAARYIELNPVRAGMARTAGDYPWSSAAFHMGLRPDDPLVRDRSLQELAGDWQEFLGGGDDHEIESLRAATKTGRPSGNKDFLSKIAAITGRNIEPGKSGRPVKK